jgi:hypothetical protein
VGVTQWIIAAYIELGLATRSSAKFFVKGSIIPKIEAFEFFVLPRYKAIGYGGL